MKARGANQPLICGLKRKQRRTDFLFAKKECAMSNNPDSFFPDQKSSCPVRPSLPCPRCGSTHTELSATYPGRGAQSKLEKLLSLFRRRQEFFPGGQFFVVCKDCGKVSHVCIL